MRKGNIAKIDFSEERIARQADKYYNEGNYFSALRLAYRQYEMYGGDGEVFARLCDIYEGMNLHGSAVNWWFRFLDIADEEDIFSVGSSIPIYAGSEKGEEFIKLRLNKIGGPKKKTGNSRHPYPLI